MDASLFSLLAEPGQPSIVIKRALNAPRERVYRLLTDPALVPLWMGPRHLTTTVEQMDVRPGGAWRLVQRDPAGNTYAFHGVYQEVSPPERLVRTFEFEGAPGTVVIETLTLEARGDQTVVTTTSQFPSVSARDGMLRAGMEAGAAEGWERAAALLREGEFAPR